MGILNTEIVDKNSPVWVGFLHFLLSVALMVFFAIVVTVLLFPFGIVGLYFSNPGQDITLYIISTFLGVWVASFFLANRQSPYAVLASSTSFFVGLQILFLLALFFGDQTPHYGSTGRDEFFTTFPMSIIMSIEFYVLNRIFLNKKYGEIKNG